MRKRFAHGLAITLAVVSLGAAQRPTSSGSNTAQVDAPKVEETLHKKLNRAKPYQIGTASWYGESFQGKPTASGEPYNMYDLTAAHLALPLGTMVRITNLRNGHTVMVRINDRGPVVPDRILDVSYSAAKVLGFKSRGVQRVRIDVVHPQVMTAALHTPTLP
ncbi:MAG TPA: septal ring lytic transglycosylase RlpA family protein [Terriglobales bacterium]|nr:septal ring lytic transglycosylase RlpA family protein [Terriglobales bacterium]